MNASLHFSSYGLEVKIESGTIILYKKKLVWAVQIERDAS